MKKLNKYFFILAAGFSLTACSINRTPESEFSDADFWNTETDLINASNRLYQQLDANWIDNRGDDALNTNPNAISNGTWTIPGSSGDWNDRYDEIFTANNILEKASKASVTEAVRNRYYGEARFFRAYAYLNLVQKYGAVPLVLKTLDYNSPELMMGRTPRVEVMKAIYDDLDFAAEWLPARSALAAAQYGRVTKSSAWALKARAGLFAGTWAKFHNDGEAQTHLQVAIDAAEKVLTQGHTLFPSYPNLFQRAGEGPGNTENILVKIFGVSSTNLILGHAYSRDLENGRVAPTRNLLRQFLYTDGLPAFNTDGTPSATKSPLFVPEANETSYGTIYENRDPRFNTIIFKSGEEAYKGPWIPAVLGNGPKTAFPGKKGFNIEDWTINGAGTVDRILIRYGEVLVTLAEALYERDNAISDADLERTVNALRKRAGFNVKLTNAFATANNLSLREEIRRERTVELALEGFRYNDLIRWKTAEIALPTAMLGAKYIAADWPGQNPASLNLNADQIVIAEPANTRSFRPNRDYLYPIPVREVNLSGGNVTQNPNWQ
ncbi:MAG: RagB/SusD family nutrient uptake outer membrane protein [Chitinophagaceae bacterium]|nr:MAG: RagB/SusD family nutrient uptake outer membrane protein [Chitinophagaceae bacterium]